MLAERRSAMQWVHFDWRGRGSEARSELFVRTVLAHEKDPAFHTSLFHLLNVAVLISNAVYDRQRGSFC